jgi:hypothetical protein
VLNDLSLGHLCGQFNQVDVSVTILLEDLGTHHIVSEPDLGITTKR